MLHNYSPHKLALALTEVALNEVHLCLIDVSRDLGMYTPKAPEFPREHTGTAGPRSYTIVS